MRRTARDPFWDDGQGARKLRTRKRITSTVALAIAIAACGLTTAAWLREIGPAVAGLLGG